MSRLTNHGKLEKDLQNSVIEYLKYNGVFCWRQNNIPVYDPKKGTYRSMPKYSMNGIPDVICILPGSIFIGIEVKLPGKKLSDDQKIFHKDCPGKLYRVDHFEQIKKIFREDLKHLLD